MYASNDPGLHAQRDANARRIPTNTAASCRYALTAERVGETVTATCVFALRTAQTQHCAGEAAPSVAKP
jgi:hypothetical protein